MIGEPETYYYVSGTPVSVRRRDDLIAVKFRGIDSSSAAARSGVGTDVPGFGPPAVEDLWPGGEVLLRQLPGEIRSPEQQEALFRALNQRADVERASFVYELNPDDHWIATDQLVVQFRAAVSESDIAALNREYGVEQVERIPWLPRAYLLQVTPASPGDALSVANAYVESEQVVFAHPNFLRKYAHRIAVLQPDAALAARHWHLSAIQAFEAWQISSGNPDVVVAIIDDGTDLDHAAFPNQVGEHHNVIDESGDPRPPAEKAKHYAHGTACAGLAVGAPNQEIGTSGVAPGCQLMAIRMLDRVIPLTVEEKLEEALTEAEELTVRRALSVVEAYREARALQWASEHGADVISNSWGPPDGYAKFGKEFVPPSPREYRKKVKGAQEAHEAIRPTSVMREPETIRRHLKGDQHRLYTLIWQRFLASQMADARFDQTTVEIEAAPDNDSKALLLRAINTQLRFPGYRQLYEESRDNGEEEDEGKNPLPGLAADDALVLLDLLPEQHFTEPPPRYTEASLVRTLEENGIGRPSNVGSEKGRIGPFLSANPPGEGLSTIAPPASLLCWPSRKRRVGILAGVFFC